MAPEHVLVPHRTYGIIINMQPSFITVSALVEHIDSIVPAACGLAVVVKHPTELIVRRIRRFPRNGCHEFWTDRATEDS
jgi:hypothetical protein